MPAHSLAWYIQRLRAMSLREVALRLRQKKRRWEDRRFREPTRLPGLVPGRYPLLPAPGTFPSELSAPLRRDAEALARGEWRFFSDQTVHVDLPPDWNRDYLSGKTAPRAGSSFRIDHRSPAPGVDIKCLWELSRWQHLTRLALGAWAVERDPFSDRCLDLLEDWLVRNPAYEGWNWTSALESGMRLLNFTWIDAFLAGAGTDAARLDALRGRVLPAHLHFTDRHRSFGSSANNHLIGELAGLIAALTRWPTFQTRSLTLAGLKRDLEREIVAQFSEDGGNREQAFNYHLYSLELCLHAAEALRSVGLALQPPARERLQRAADFYTAMLPPGPAAWDYGDSDDAFGLPLYGEEQTRRAEWSRWFQGGEARGLCALLGPWQRSPTPEPGTSVFRESGYAILRNRNFFLRLDASPLGYLRTAAHGHCDALHLSAWVGETPFLIDPGTGGYYGDLESRCQLAGWGRHNGPSLPDEPGPIRAGPFLWRAIPPAPEIEASGDEIAAMRAAGDVRFRRRVELRDVRFRIIDEINVREPSEISIVWQLAPEWEVEQTADGFHCVHPSGRSIHLLISTGAEFGARLERARCSPAFRRLEESWSVAVSVRTDSPCTVVSTFSL